MVLSVLIQIAQGGFFRERAKSRAGFEAQMEASELCRAVQEAVERLIIFTLYQTP